MERRSSPPAAAAAASSPSGFRLHPGLSCSDIMVDSPLDMRSKLPMWKFHRPSKLSLLVDDHQQQQQHHHRHQPPALAIAAAAAAAAAAAVATVDDDDHRPSCERPVLAVPFKWEASPGVAKSSSRSQSLQSPLLVPPPHLALLLGSSTSCSSIPPSPRSPRSISLSKKMRSLLQGKKLCRKKSSLCDDTSSSGCSSQPTSPKFDDLSQKPHADAADPAADPEFLPFKQVSTMLLDIWYGDSSSTSPCSSSSELESPASSSSDYSSSTFSNYRAQDFDTAILQDDDDEDIDFEALLHEKLLKSSNRFRVEASNSASLLSDSRKNRQHLQSSLKKPSAQKHNKVVKKVRFAPLAEEEYRGRNAQAATEVDSGASSPPVLCRYSSRPASRYEHEENFEYFYDEDEFPVSPLPRPKRDLAELVMHIIQTDAADFAAARRHKSPLIKIFRSSSRGY